MRLPCGKLGACFTGVTILLAALAAAELPLVSPKEAAEQLKKGPAPMIVQVGPNVLYRSKHIAGAIYAGPGNKPEGLELLKAAVKDVAHDREILLYCGCCPWDRCPNVKPAIEVLKEMGFTKVKAMQIPTNFKTDWIDQGYPVE